LRAASGNSRPSSASCSFADAMRAQWKSLQPTWSFVGSAARDRDDFFWAPRNPRPWQW
jgi:hypothetical protein